MTATGEIRQGDCIEAMRELADCSVDAVVCDPPYGLEFMGKDWDRLGDIRQPDDETFHRSGVGPFDRAKVRHGYDVPIAAMQEWHHAWATEARRILKPGGHLLAFGGTRTYHRLACAIEDAGFEIRDTICWLYGSGFPKSCNIGDGWGTALKPAHEPIVVARKPLTGTVAGNVLEHGTGALNVDGCRIELGDERAPAGSGDRRGGNIYAQDEWTRTQMANGGNVTPPEGRWPANVVLSHTEDCQQVGVKKVKPVGATAHKRHHGKGQMLNPGEGKAEHPGYRDPDGTETVAAWECSPDCPVRMLDEQSGILTSGANPTRRGSDKFRTAYGDFEGQRECQSARGVDVGGASRFFYCAKASRTERNAGLEGFEERDHPQFEGAPLNRPEHESSDGTRRSGERPPRANHHPTVKPIALMRWLVRLVCPPGGLVLDPFAGSGTTGCAAVLEGFDFLGLEREAEYVEIARARIGYWADPRSHELRLAQAERERLRAEAEDRNEPFQLDLLDGESAA